MEVPALAALTVFARAEYRWAFHPYDVHIFGLAFYAMSFLWGQRALLCKMWMAQVFVPASAAH